MLEFVVPEAPVPARATAVVLLLPGTFVDRLSDPEKEPVVEGLNFTCNVALLPGFRLRGKDAPETEKPVPETLADLMVRAVVPLEVTVSDLVDDEPAVTLPKLSDVALRARAGLAAYSVTTNVLDVDWACAEMVTDCVAETLEA